MAIVIITDNLKKDVFKKFKNESKEVFKLMLSLEDQPHKGKYISQVGNIVIKEIRYKSFRFYFITDKYKIKILNPDELKDLLIKFVRMSDKNDQQERINEIKTILRTFGGEGFT